MPLFESEDEALVQAPAQPSNPNLVRPTVTTAESNKVNGFAYANLITHAEGYRWKVDALYSQFLTDDMEPAFLSLDREAVYQQYLEIKDFEFRVDSPLQSQQDSEGKEFTVTGSGLTYPGLHLNRGDFFIADIADGRKAIIEIVDVEDTTLFKETVRRINYRVRDYLNDAYLKDIKSKVSESKIFVMEFFDYGKNPVIAESDFNDYLKLKDCIETLTEFHFTRFMDGEYNNIPVPNQSAPTMDLKFSKFVSMFMHGSYDTIYRNLAADLATDLNDLNLWDILEKDDLSLLRIMSYKNSLYSVTELNWHPVVSPIRYSGIKSIYSPLKLNEVEVDPIEPSPIPTFRNNFDPDAYAQELLKDVRYHELVASEIKPFNKSGADEYYVFSSAFYNGVGDEMSLLERLTLDKLESELIQVDLLLTLGELIKYQDDLTMFYQIPILIFLMEAKMGDI